MGSKHFANKEAIEHVLEKRAEGFLSISESHGRESPGYLAAGADACKETALVLLLAWLFLMMSGLAHRTAVLIFAAFGLGFVVWKAGRSGWLGWSRLERLHRLIEQEKYEIEHHRPQEKEEIVALYSAKGFEGKLLDEVADVLMADQDRLLKVMLEEEMGLTLQVYEHPLQQTLGALLGALISYFLALGCFFFFPRVVSPVACFLLVAAAAGFSAFYEKNRVIQAIVWNVSIAALAFGTAYFLYKLFI